MNVSALKWLTGIGAVVVTGVVAGGALAGPGRPVAGRRGAGPFRAAMATVGLSAAQRERIRAIMIVERPSLEALRGRRQTSKAELDAALAAPEPDPTAVGNALLRTRASRQALRAEMKKVREQTVSVLTPDQKAKLDGYLEGVRSMRHRGRV